MKQRALWALGLLLLAAALSVLAYGQRNFGGLLAGLAIVLAACAVLVRPLRTLLTTVVSIVLALAFVELALGWLQPDSALTRYDRDSDYVKHYWSQTDIGSIPRSGVHSTRKLTANGDLIYAASYTIGDDGFRVTPGSEGHKGPKGGQRANFLGCSVTFGEGLNDGDTFPARVGNKLPQTQIKNYGIHGYGMHQALAILESDRDTSGTLNFVLTAPWHAERSACLPSFALGSPRYRRLADGGVQRDGVCGGIAYYPAVRLLSQSRVYNLVKQAAQAREGQDAQIDLYLALIQRMAELSRSRQQTLMIGFLKADAKWFAGSFSNEKIVQRLQAMPVDLIDLTLSDKPEDSPEKYRLHKLDEHPTALANEDRAALVVGRIRNVLTR
jgi:hypothetical protein